LYEKIQLCQKSKKKRGEKGEVKKEEKRCSPIPFVSPMRVWVLEATGPQKLLHRERGKNPSEKNKMDCPGERQRWQEGRKKGRKQGRGGKVIGEIKGDPLVSEGKKKGGLQRSVKKTRHKRRKEEQRLKGKGEKGSRLRSKKRKKKQ